MSRAARMVPEPRHDLLLRAALDPDPDRALAARARWLQAVDLDQLDFGSLQLLPLLDLRDPSDASEAALVRQVRHVVRFTWLRTQLLVRRVGPVVRAMREAGLDPMLSKGAALVHGHGIEPSRRPMFDIDVSVEPDRLGDALQLLGGLGFRSPIDRALAGHRDALLRDSHAVAFDDGAGAAIDLHWHLLHAARNPALDAAVHRRAVACTLAGEACRATSVEDTLVISVVHGSRWARGAAVRWVGDVALLVRAHGDRIDWDQVVRSAREARAGRQTADALAYVQRLTGAGPPASVARGLRALPDPVAARLRRRRRDLDDGGPAPASRAGVLIEAYEEDVASVAMPGARTGPADAARFLARRWGLASARRVPVHAAWVAAGRPWGVRRAGGPLTRDERGQIGAWPHYALGTELRFDDAGDGHRRLGPGWWYPEPHGVWARAHCARILLPLASQPPVDELRLELRLHAAPAPLRPSQRAAVVFGTRPVATVSLDAERPVRHLDVVVPARELTQEVVAVISVCSDPVMSPADSRLNSDLRQIGIGVSALTLSLPED